MTDQELDNLINKAVAQTEAALERRTCLMPSRIWGLKLGTLELEDSELQHLQACARCRAIGERVSEVAAVSTSNALRIPLMKMGLAAAGANSASSPISLYGAGWEVQVTPEEGELICDIYVAADKAACALVRYCFKTASKEHEPIVLAEGLAALRLSPLRTRRTGQVRVALPPGDTERENLEFGIEPITPENLSAVAATELDIMIQRVDDDEVGRQLRRLKREQSRMI